MSTNENTSFDMVISYRTIRCGVASDFAAR